MAEIRDAPVEATATVPAQEAHGLATAQTYVVDTGVFVRWFLAQDGYEHAREIQKRFVLDEITLVTTDIARIELAHVLRTKGCVPGLLDRNSYVKAVRTIDDLGMEIRPTDAETLERAVDWAVQLSLRFFDALFVDLAVQTGCPLLTSDIRLARAATRYISTEVLRPR
ncbi:type II toxin-antitoxin system VapC family toxin [Protofrankia symbiont of Coriaria ruscifolia]|uniref:type II toxin-antitoxin system VapC family toxin n=1 Tax=Protofrankia symbiont of Coriaria ruscifolia TaxID=1306542 RepID=UPI0013EF8B2D|nr:type II toxin-antitoxin system VapC family toxin [Protofrankia symbiont of Coriaria ruscifolia]